jgi:integrase
MAKRTFHDTEKDIYQYKADGNFYFRKGKTEFCLQTSDVVKAAAYRNYIIASMSYLGPAAFNFRVRDLFPVFLKEKKKDVRPRTLSLYESIWRSYLEPSIGRLKLAEVTQRNWEKVIRAYPTVKDFQNHRNLTHQFLVWCEMKEFLRAVPTLKNPAHKRRRRKIIPPDHMVLIFRNAAASNGGLLLFLSFIAFHGNRNGEIIKLPLERIDLNRLAVLFGDEDVKTGQGRETPLNRALVPLIGRHLSRLENKGVKSKWLFPNAVDPKRHMDATGFKTAWKLCIKRAGLEAEGYTWHDFRSTYEKWMHKSKDFTATQREKMVGAGEDVQKRVYVSMNADDLRGLENVVQIPEINRILESQTVSLKGQLGNQGEEESPDRSNIGVNHE